MRAIGKLKFCAATAGLAGCLAFGAAAQASQWETAAPATAVAQPVAYWGHGYAPRGFAAAPGYWRYGHGWNRCWGGRCGGWGYYAAYPYPYAPYPYARPAYPYPPVAPAPRAYGPPPPAARAPAPAPMPAPGPAPGPGRQSLQFQPAPPPANAVSY